jgi:hypothetical protein
VVEEVYRLEAAGSKGRLIKVPSDSRPGRVYMVDTESGRCSCPGFHYTGSCKHVERLTGFHVEPRHDSRTGDYEFLVIERKSGVCVGIRSTFEDALADVEELEVS